jgi:hypothetical protein
LVVTPLSGDNFPIEGEEGSDSVDEIVAELPFISFSIAEEERALSVLVVIFEVALVVDPDVFGEVEVAEIEFALKFLGGFVVKNAVAVQGVVLPLTLIGDSAVRVVEGPSAVHLAVLPVSTVLSSLVVVESTIAVAEAFDFSPLVPSFGELLLDISRVGHLLRSHVPLGRRFDGVSLYG